MTSTVARIMTAVTTLVAPVVRMEGPAAIPARGATEAPSTFAIRQLHASPPTANGAPIQRPNRVLGVPGILELYEGEAGRIPGHPNTPQMPVVAEGVLQVLFAGVVAQVAHIHLTVAGMTRHFGLKMRKMEILNLLTAIFHAEWKSSISQQSGQIFGSQ